MIGVALPDTLTLLLLALLSSNLPVGASNRKTYLLLSSESLVE